MNSCFRFIFLSLCYCWGPTHHHIRIYNQSSRPSHSSFHLLLSQILLPIPSGPIPLLGEDVLSRTDVNFAFYPNNSYQDTPASLLFLSSASLLALSHSPKTPKPLLPSVHIFSQPHCMGCCLPFPCCSSQIPLYNTQRPFCLYL